MLILKRNIWPYEVIKCRMSDELIVYGDYYYEDDDDGLIVKATIYRKTLMDARKLAFDYTLLEQSKSEQEYKNAVKRAEKDYLRATILDRKVADQGEVRDANI